MMEVDMQSSPSSFRSVPFTIKRPRSPGSPTQERQTKRLSLAPIGLEGQCGRRPSTTPDGVVDSRTANQDDWVRQARELSLTSPLSVSAGFPPALNAGPAVAQGRVDEHMAVDDEGPQGRVHPHPGSSRPWATRSHLPSIHITTTPALSPGGLQSGVYNSPAPFSVLTEPPSSSTESLSSTSSVSTTQTRGDAPRPPDIFLFPATPSDTPSHHHHFTSGYEPQAGEGDAARGRMQDQDLSQSSPARVQDRIEGSLRPSRADVPTSSSRKHRVTMGPRADCVKCRTGVRGHWMHFD